MLVILFLWPRVIGGMVCIRQKALSLWMRLFWLRDEVPGSFIKFGIISTVLSFSVDLHRSAQHSTVVARRFVKKEKEKTITNSPFYAA